MCFIQFEMLEINIILPFLPSQSIYRIKIMKDTHVLYYLLNNVARAYVERQIDITPSYFFRVNKDEFRAMFLNLRDMYVHINGKAQSVSDKEDSFFLAGFKNTVIIH